MLKPRFYIIFLAFILFSVPFYAQEKLELDLEEAEKLLLENNLGLLAEELNLDRAEAEKIQAKVWPNPTLEIEEFNPFVTDYQKRHAEEQASLINEDFGKYRQFAIQLEQVFNLAGKRKKQKAIADVSAEEAAAYLADFLLELKTEFRKTIYRFSYNQHFIQTLENQLETLENLSQAYKRQYEKGNVNKMEVMRLHASELTLKDEIITLKNTLSELESDLILLMNQPDNTSFSFESILGDDEFEYSFPYELDEVLDEAIGNRPDVRLSKLQKEKADKQYTYEKAQRTPDLGVSVTYDRGGGIYPDFVGLGLEMDLPFSNPNKGNIKKAQIEIQQRDYEHEQHLKEVKTSVKNTYKKVVHLSDFLADVEPDYLKDLDRMMEAYTEYFRKRNINSTTYMDYMEAYMDNRKAVLKNQKDFLEALEDLSRATGLELNTN